MVGLQANYSVQHLYTSKAWHVGSNAYAPTQSCLRTIGRGFSFFMTKDVLQLLHNLIFELRSLIGMEFLGWSEHTKYPFDKSFCSDLLFLVLKCDEHSKSSEMIYYR